MTVKEKLLEEFEAAINAVYGDIADDEYTEDSITVNDIDAIRRKVLFYLFY